MTELRVSVRARCEACHAIYRVGCAERTYTCKACGGTVRALDSRDDAPHQESRASSVPAGTVTCFECEAINPGGLHFCAECGTSLPDAEQHAVTPAARQLREEAAAALDRVSRGFQILTWTYQIGAVAYAIATFFAVRALASPDVPVEGGLAVVALTTLLSVMFGMGALHAHFRPFGWTVAIAVATAAVTAIHLFGPNPLGLAALGSALWTLVAFGLLVPTFWFQKQIRRHKDLYILHHAKMETRRSLRNQSAQERHERLLEVMRRAALRTWLVSASIAVVVVLFSAVGSWFYVSARPAPLQPPVARFEEAWNGGIDDVAAVVDPSSRTSVKQRLLGAALGHGWEAGLPKLSEAHVEASEAGATITYEADGVGVTTHWTLSDNRWQPYLIELPVPGAGPTLERFQAAWAASDLQAILGFFATDAREEMRATLEAAIEKRGWSPLPSILEARTTESEDDARIGLVLVVESGEIVSRWYYDYEGSWRIGSLTLPAR